MDRRGFFQSSMILSALTATGRLPALAHRADPRNIFTDPPAIEPLTHAVSQFRPSAVAPESPFEWSRQYALFRWHGIRPDGRAANPPSGTLELRRNGSADAGQYRVRQRLLLPAYEHDGPVKEDQLCRLDADLQVRGADESVKSWSVCSRHCERGTETEQPQSRLTLKGHYDGRMLSIAGHGLAVERSLSGPLIPAWAIPGLLAGGRLDRSAPFHFTMLEEGIKIRPDQLLVCDGAVELKVAGGIFRGEIWMQTGTGVLPIHWVLDESGRVQIMTHSVMSWLYDKPGT